MNSLTIHRRGQMFLCLSVAVLALLLLKVCAVPPVLAARPGTWTPTGNVKSNRIFNAMALLQNGQALVAGGHIINPSGKITTLSSAELDDPTTDTWSYVGSIHAARESFTVTALTSGQVLAVGGLYEDPIKGPIALASAELYNPATGKWTLTGSLHTARNEQTATLLHDGHVLVAGGNTGIFVGLASAELYDPAAGRWTATGSMTTVRRGNTMTLLPNGQVLVAGGGAGAGTLLASAELYHPSTGTWSLTGSLPHPLDQFTATLLPNGQVLAAGGNDGDYTAGAELYSPGTGEWTTTGSLNRPHAAHTAVLLQNGDVLIAGGLYNIFHPRILGAEYYTP